VPFLVVHIFLLLTNNAGGN